MLSETLGRRIGYSVSGGFLSRHGQDNTVDHYVKEKYLSKKCRNKLPIYSGITPEGACARLSLPTSGPTNRDQKRDSHRDQKDKIHYYLHKYYIRSGGVDQGENKINNAVILDHLFRHLGPFGPFPYRETFQPRRLQRSRAS